MSAAGQDFPPTGIPCWFLRQIHPNSAPDGVVQSGGFLPTKNHQFKLSGYDGDRITPAESFDFHTGILGKKSVAVMGVTIEECLLPDIMLASSPVPQSEGVVASRFHIHLDFSGMTNGQRERTAKKLRDLATARGILHP